MAEVTISFAHPTDGQLLNVEAEDTLTAQEAIAELICANFISSNQYGYHLYIKGGNMIGDNQSFREAGVLNGAVIRVIPLQGC